MDEELKDNVVYISSAGKTFGLTGWKVGWAMCSAELTSAIIKVHQFNTFCVAHPLQKAIAYAIDNRKSYLKSYRSDYLNKRNLFTRGLEKVGLNPIWSQGTYFTLCPTPRNDINDIDFCRELIQKFKVSAIPPSAFYQDSNDGHKYVRFCFAKKNKTLEHALELLKGLNNEK
jgi:aspartate/methionine/tyrosine aminotransferase